MSVIINLLSGVFVVVAGGIILYKKMPDIKQNLAIKRELARIEREAYLREAVITAEKKGIQKARAGLNPLDNILKAREHKSQVSKEENKPKHRHTINKAIRKLKINKDKIKIEPKPIEEQKQKEEFSKMRELMGVKKDGGL